MVGGVPLPLLRRPPPWRWESMNEVDRKWYLRQEARDNLHRARMKKLEERLPRRMEVLAMVRAGKMTLAEGQKLIKKEERAKDREEKQG